MKRKNKLIFITILIFSIFFNKVSYAEFSNIVAESAIVMDMDTKEVIASKNADNIMPMASTIKLLTSLLFAENVSKNDEISFTEDALKTTISSLSKFKNLNVGDKISSVDLMKAVMILSANDAAYLMADAVSGNSDEFVNLMNDRVKSLGLNNTTIVNPCGLESNALHPENKEINLSTAYDMAIIATEAYQNEWVREVMMQKSTDIDLAGSKVILQSKNKLLGQNGNVGGKTGNETKSGRCFIGFFERDGRNLVTVALKSIYGLDDTIVFDDTLEIANTGYDKEKEIYKKSGEIIDTVELEYRVFGFFGKKKTINANILAVNDLYYYQNDINDNNIDIEYNGKKKSAWKLANKNIDMTFSILSNEEEIKGKVDLSKFELIKANIFIYISTFIGSLAFLIMLAFTIRYVNISKKRRRRKSSI